jgi:hypothetical protein
MLSRSVVFATMTLIAGACQNRGYSLTPPAVPSADTETAVADWLTAGDFSVPGLGEPAAADVATLRFLKVRETDELQCLAIEWHDQTGEYWSGILGLSRSPDARWDVDGGGWGSGPPPDLGIDEPRAHLAGGWNDHFCLGSWVYDPTGTIAFARLVSGDTVLAEDTVDDGVIVFLGAVPFGPDPMVELYDSEGSLVVRHEP